MLAATSVAGVILALALAEGLLALLLAQPGPAARWQLLLDRLRSVYVREDWSVVQTDPRLVTYDPQLTYLLRPGARRFENREFDTTLAANSAGLRDDEASLERPDVIVLGDSYALGWGVEQDETFAQVLERRTGLRVLNAAMPSFGTAREVLLLRRLDTANARAVVVQYYLNDFEENRAFVAGGFELAATPRQAFEQWQRRARRQARYRPLDYLRAFLDRSSFFPWLETTDPETAARICLETLAWSEELEEVPIFFLEIDAWAATRLDLAAAMSKVLAADETYSDLRRRLTLVPLTGVLSPEDFFLLDPHLRPRGHRKVAAELERALGRAGIL